MAKIPVKSNALFEKLFGKTFRKLCILNIKKDIIDEINENFLFTVNWSREFHLRNCCDDQEFFGSN